MENDEQLSAAVFVSLGAFLLLVDPQGAVTACVVTTFLALTGALFFP